MELNKDLIAKIRKEVPELADFPIYNHDFELQNWLIHYNHDLHQICPKLREYLAIRRYWNSENFEDTTYINPISRQRFPSTLIGTEDNAGNLLQVEQWGIADIQGLSIKAIEQQEKLQKPVGTFMILDLQGLDRSIPYLTVAKGPQYEVIKWFEEFYPETSKRTFVINAPTWFAWVFAFFKPWLPKKTREKLHVLDKHYHHELLKYFKPDQLPTMYGGTFTEADKNWGLMGTKVPLELYYSLENDPFYPGADKIQTCTIRRASKLELQFNFAAAGRFRYWFTTEHYIIFAIYLVPNESDPVQRQTVHPPLRLCTHRVPERRELRIPEAGTIVVEFSNEVSWFTSKTVHYYFEVKC